MGVVNIAQESREVEKEYIRKRELKGHFAKIVVIIGILASLYHLYIAGFGSTSAMKLRCLHWTFISILVFLLYPPTKKSSRKKITWLDIFLALLALVAGLYVYFNWDAVIARAGFTTFRDTIFGVIMTILVLEASRRAVGLPITILAGIFLAYSYLGPYLPNVLAHKGYSTTSLIRVLYMSLDGIYGIPIGVSASYIVLFIIFGAFLNTTGGGKFFNDLAFALVGKSPGGPAKGAVLSSSLMGMISGAAVSNVVSTGTFTIPLMKKSGYPGYMAGAIEAVASTGGQFVPPVMGAAAFMIAQMTGENFRKVAFAAIIPVILYYTSLYVCVHLEARKRNIKGINEEEIPSLKDSFKARGHLVIPIIILFYSIAIGYSPAKAIFWSIIILIIVSMLRKTTRLNFRDFIDVMGKGIQNAIPVATACAAAGIITGIISLTGLGLRFSSILISLSGNSVFLMLILTMIASIVIGMGLPTSAAYILLAILAAPGLIELGVEPLAAHFFIFFFGCISTITPPVALSAYAGAGIADANPMKTGYTAFRLALVAYVIPFIGVYRPAILMLGSPLKIILSFIPVIIGMLGLTYGVGGFNGRHLLKVERSLFIISAILLLTNLNVIFNTLGIIIFLIMLFRTRSDG